MGAQLTPEDAEERVAIELVRRGYVILERAPNRFFPDWDIKTNIGTFEVKQDNYYPKRSQCVFVETHDRGHFSGLKRTVADYFIVVAQETGYVATTQNWLDFIRGNAPYLEKKKGGDDLAVRGVLVPGIYLTASKIGGLEEWHIPFLTPPLPKK